MTPDPRPSHFYASPAPRCWVLNGVDPLHYPGDGSARPVIPALPLASPSSPAEVIASAKWEARRLRSTLASALSSLLPRTTP